VCIKEEKISEGRAVQRLARRGENCSAKDEPASAPDVRARELRNEFGLASIQGGMSKNKKTSPIAL